MAQGGNQANLNLKLVSSIPIILPSLSLQQQFAEKIEKIEKQKE
jgi:restriction endonuclease S subunit